MRPCSLSIAALSLLALPAAGAIQSATSGTLVHSPTGLIAGNAFGGQYAHAWNERQSFVLTNQAVDLLGNGNSNSPTPGLVSGLVDSHMLHAESGWPINPSVHSGTVTFNAPIVGVIWTAAGLNGSDLFCAPAGTSYSTSASRGLVPGSEWVVVSGNAITFQFIRGQVFPYEYTQVRVLTAVPGPGAGVVLGAAGLVCARRRRA
ncbi:MAG: hypothetical protein KDA05_01190 [Phycisphaerales bacterium]|nr:hypothetical protein [Phycisphaerales bacterium]